MRKYFLTLSSTILMGLVVAAYMGLPQFIWMADLFYISTTIALVATVAYIVAWQKQAPNLCSVAGSICTSLGLFGTVIGFTGMLANISSGDASQLVYAAVALHTTAVGIVASVVLLLEEEIIVARWNS